MTSAVLLGLLVLLEAQNYHSCYRSGTNRSRFLVVFNIFTALHGMQTRSSDENSVCLSVCLSVHHTREL